MRQVTIAAAMSLAAIHTTPAPAEPHVAAVLTGQGIAEDGDGIRFGRVEVRLRGVAAPEIDAPGGAAAAQALAALIDGAEVVCHLDGSTANRRPVGICFVRGEDVGAAVIRAGLARDCPRYSGGLYAADEAAAVAAGLDLSATYPLPGYCEPRD